MWNKLTKLRWNEQTRFFALAGVTAVLLLVALLLPLAFRRTASGQSASGAGDGASNSATELKAALFAGYWYGDAGEIEVRKVERPASKTAELCQARMDELVERYINDLALDRPIAQGSEYTVVTGGDTQLRLCRMWLQVQGDWHNWMDVCMDAETGNLYYFYVSRECLTNRGLYSFSAEEKPTVELLAERLAEDWGSRLRHVQRDGMGKGTAVLGSDSGTLAFEISCITYDALIDIKASCI
ncbi:MAG: hypothetical protein IJ617_02195 [Oscillospiraceae bacterium]|nr:hypothetical protein [Oscillospiraceae bacterium]